MSAPTLAARVISESGFHAAPHGTIDRPLRPLRADYATAPIDRAFDWAECLTDTPARFKRPTLLIVGCGDIGMRVVRLLVRAGMMPTLRHSETDAVATFC